MTDKNILIFKELLKAQMERERKEALEEGNKFEKQNSE